MNKVPPLHERQPELTPKRAMLAGITAMTLVAIASRLDCDCDAHDIPQDVTTSDHDVIELNSLHNAPAEGEKEAKHCLDQTIVWSLREVLSEDGKRKDEFVVDFWSQGLEKVHYNPRSKMYECLMFNKNGMFKIRSHSVRRTWARSGEGEGGDPEVLNKQILPTDKRRGFPLTHRK